MSIFTFLFSTLLEVLHFLFPLFPQYSRHFFAFLAEFSLLLGLPWLHSLKSLRNYLVKL